MKEKSIFVEFAGDSPFFAMIDFFLDNREGDYTKLDVMKYTGMSRGTLFKYWNNLERYKIVKVTRKFGKTKLFSCNINNPIVKSLCTLEGELIKKFLNEKSEKKKIEAKNSAKVTEGV